MRTRAKQLLIFPRSGRIVPEYETDGFRELIERPYRILYLVEPDRVLITAVVHGAMDLRPDESPGDGDHDAEEA